MVWTALGGLDATKAKKPKDKIKIFIEKKSWIATAREGETSLFK